MSDVLHLHTVFEDPILPPPDIIPGRNILLLGVSTKGTQYEPIYVKDSDQMKEFYGSGPLVDAYIEAESSDAYAIYVYRLNANDEPTLTDEEMYDRLGNAYNDLTGFPVHIVVPVGVYLDNANYDFAQQLLDFCAEKKNDGGALGVIGVSEADPGNLSNHVDTLMNNSFMREVHTIVEEDHETDIGSLLVVVAHDTIFNKDKEDEYTANAVHAVAGLLSSLDSNVRPTNKALKGIYDLPYRYGETTEKTDIITFDEPLVYLSRIPLEPPSVTDGAATPVTYVEGDPGDYLIDYDNGTIERVESGLIGSGGTVHVTYKYQDNHSLAKRGYTTLRDSVKKGIVIYQGVTAASPSSMYHSLSNSRIVLEILSLIQDVKANILGEPLKPALLSGFQSELKDVLESKIADRSISGYSAQIQVDHEERALIIHLDIVPIGEITSISSVVRLDV